MRSVTSQFQSVTVGIIRFEKEHQNLAGVFPKQISKSSFFCILFDFSEIRKTNYCSHFPIFVALCLTVSYYPGSSLPARLCAADGADGAIARRHGRSRAVPGADLCFVPFSVPIYVCVVS
jgi:hypothetical protein